MYPTLKADKNFSPGFERLLQSVGEQVQLRQRLISSPGTSACPQESSKEDTRDAISVDFQAGSQMSEHWMLATELEKLMVCDVHFLVLESKMSFLLNSVLAGFYALGLH